MITPEKLSEIDSRCKAATPGPWYDFEGRLQTEEGKDLVESGRHWDYGFFELSADSDFTANARQDVPDLLAEVRRLRDSLDTAEKREQEREAAIVEAACRLQREMCVNYAEACPDSWKFLVMQAPAPMMAAILAEMERGE